MKTSTTAVLGFAGLALGNVCNNNCGRQVTGTARQSPALTARSAECSAFLTSTTTITPPTATVTNAPILVRNVHGLREVEAPVLTGEKPAYASSCPDITAYWNACQCFGITPTLVTEIAPTPTHIIEAPTCTQGLEFALYAPRADSVEAANLQLARNNGIDKLDLSLLISGKTPDAQGVSPFVSNINNDDTSLPIGVYGVTGPADSSLARSIIDHRGFIYPEVEGTYKVTIKDADDVTFFWAGEPALSGFHQSNAALTKTYGGSAIEYTFDVSEDEVNVAVPIRLLWINWAGRGVQKLEIVDPNGVTILGPNTQKNSQILASCAPGDYTLAPEWVSWESEVVGSAPVPAEK